MAEAAARAAEEAAARVEVARAAVAWAEAAMDAAAAAWAAAELEVVVPVTEVDGGEVAAARVHQREEPAGNVEVVEREEDLVMGKEKVMEKDLVQVQVMGRDLVKEQEQVQLLLKRLSKEHDCVDETYTLKKMELTYGDEDED